MFILQQNNKKLITKHEEVTKQGFCKTLWRKLRPRIGSWSSGKSLIRIYSLKWVGWGWALIWVWLWGGRGGHLLTFSAFRMGPYSRWALIRGWALIRINTVVPNFQGIWEMEYLSPRNACLLLHHLPAVPYLLSQWHDTKQMEGMAIFVRKSALHLDD